MNDNLKSNIKIKYNMKELFHLHLSKLGCFKKSRIVSRRIMLVALLSLLTLPVFAETSNSIGVFFVSQKKLVTFAPGNLQCDNTNKPAKRTWSFASEQYEILGTDNVVGGRIVKDPGDNGYENTIGTDLAPKIDLFYWSETQDAAYGVSITSYENDLRGSFVEWGNLMSGSAALNPWRTLTSAEWEYLVNRKDARGSLLYGVAVITDVKVVGGKNGPYEKGPYDNDASKKEYGVNGVIFLPDNWVCPSGITFRSGGSNGTGMSWFNDKGNNFTLEQWKKMEAAGAVFLPAGGFRSTKKLSETHVEYKMYNVQYGCGYWSSSSSSNTTASHLNFNSHSVTVNPANTRIGGRAVRLTHDTLPVEVTLPIDKVTSSAGQTVKVRIPITLSNLFGMNGNSPTTITGRSSNSAFTVMPLKNVGPGKYELIVHYTPTVTTDGIETTTITLSSNTLQGSTSFKMTGRHLAKNFVIATKVGNEWVALTADISGDGIQRALPIVVDTNTTPIKATFAFNFSQYQLLGLTNSNRFAENGTAVHLSPTIHQDTVLKASSYPDTKNGLCAEDENSFAQYYLDHLFCEWQLVSQDLVHYTIINSNQSSGWENNRILGYSSELGAWGMYSPDSTINQEIFLLPVETALADNLEVMEWGTNSMIIRFKEDVPLLNSLAIYQTGLGQGRIHNVSILNGTSDLGRIDNINLTGNNCTTIAILQDRTSIGTILRTPIIVSSGTVPVDKYKKDYDHCHLCDIVILKDATLTSSCDFINFANIHVYPGGKLYFKERADQLGAINKVYLRGGYSWLNQDTYALPEIYLNDSIYFKGSNNIYYDYYIKPYKYYQFALPYTVSLGSVTDEAGCDDFPVWVKHYNGALRAANAHATSWEYYNGPNFERGIGYAIAAKPRQVDRVMNRPLSIIRFRLGNEEFEKPIPLPLSVTTQAHGIDGYKEGTVTANNVGWNFVGNPFLSPWKGDIGHKQLIKHNDDKDQWDGSYDWVDSNVKYITVMSAENGSDYDQYVASNTELKPFFPFFMQEAADGGSGTINFAADCLKNGPLMLSAKTAPRQVFVQFEIMADGEKDQTGMFIGDHYSDDIDFDDYEKMFGSSTDNTKLWLMHEGKRMAFEAMTESTAATYTSLGYRVPRTGTYYLDVNLEVSDLTDVEAIYLSDHLAGVFDHDLLDEVYEFESENTIYNDNRFAVRVVLRNGESRTATDIENIIGIHSDSESPCKFIYQNRMYIMRNGILYDATGQHVLTINK